MSKEMTIIVLGLWVAALPYLGIPGTWRMALLVLTGLVVAIIGFLLRGESLSRGAMGSKHNTFVESTIPSPAEHTHEHKEGITSLN